MTTALPPTLLDLAGRKIALPRLADAVLVLIDLQNEYRSGPLALPGVDAAVAAAASLLSAVRAAGGRVVHVAHAGRAGGPFDRAQPRGGFVEAVAPRGGGTDLATHLPVPGDATVIVAGLMTHNCVSSTVRVAGDLGHRLVVAHDACATRALPGPGGGVVDAETLNRAALAGLGDRFARLASVAEILAAG
jgi:nicotinamidase-related amidase